MDWYLIATIGHVLGATLGVGGATVSDVLFFRSIKDRKISKEELDLLKGASLVIWTGLAILILSGISFLFLQYYANDGVIKVLGSTKFQAKIVIVAVIFINGLVFHNKVFPFLKQNAGKDMHGKEIHSRLFILAATGAISITSWYIAFVFGMLRSIPLQTVSILGFYFTFVICAIMIAYFVLSRDIDHNYEAHKIHKNSRKRKIKNWLLSQ